MAEDRSLDKADVAGPNGSTPWLLAGVAFASVVSVGLLLIWVATRIAGDDTSGTLVATSITYVTAIVAASATIAATLIKSSIDQRNLRLSQIESDRSHVLAVQASDSNRIELAIRAVDLLADTASRSQIGGAVLALANLNELQLALSLLDDLVDADRVRISVVAAIAGKGLRSQSEDHQNSAAVLVKKIAEQLQEGTSDHWPVENGWDPNLPYHARIALATAAGTWLASTIQSDLTYVGATEVLYKAATEDPDGRIAWLAAAALKPVVSNLGADSELAVGEDNVPVAEVRLRLSEVPERKSNASLQARATVLAAISSITPAAPD